MIGGFAVIANQYVRGTEDVDLLIKGDHSLDETLAHFLTSIDAQRNGRPVPLRSDRKRRDDARRHAFRPGGPAARGQILPSTSPRSRDAAINLNYHGQPARVASLASLVAFKRIAGRPRDQLDLTELERIHGELPIEPIPGIDDRG